MKIYVFETGQVVDAIQEVSGGEFVYHVDGTKLFFKDLECKPLNNIDWEQRHFDLFTVLLDSALSGLDFTALTDSQKSYISNDLIPFIEKIVSQSIDIIKTKLYK